MKEQIGIVVKAESGNYAHVITDRKNACGECDHGKHTCYGCLSSSKVISRVANPVRAGAGDLVKINLSPGKLFTAAAMFYLLPVFTLLIGAFSGVFTSTALGMTETTASIGGALAGLVTGLTGVTILGRIPGISRKIEPVITSIVMSGSDHTDT